MAPPRGPWPDRPDRRDGAPERPQRPPNPGFAPQRADRQEFVRQAPQRPAPRDGQPPRAEARPPRHDGPPPQAGPQRVRRDEAQPGSIAAEQGFRLSKVLTDRGTASRREADDWIAAGWVKVDGQMAVLGQRVLPDARIEIDPAARTQQAKQITILLNKPIGYVSGQAEDGYEPASVLVTAANHWDEDPHRLPFHPGHARGLAPAGRLDIDSTGLLVLTQNGRVAKLLIGEDSDIEKEYLVRVEYTQPGPFPEDDLKRLNHGLMLDERVLKPAKVSWANEDQLRFVLREGRKRQIRRMCELVGLKVTALKRVRIGSVVLGKLPPGQWRFLRDDERF
jgi:23S rRNA pseudouridine2604 synthase